MEVSKDRQAEILDWEALITAVSADLDAATVRVRQLRSALENFKKARKRGDPFPTGVAQPNVSNRGER